MPSHWEITNGLSPVVLIEDGNSDTIYSGNARAENR